MDEEYDEIKKHTTYGGRMLRVFNSIKDIDLGAKYHHERFDGKGYPDDILGDDIPMIARIICVADSFDAMNSNRCYRPRLTEEYIMRELIENKGKQFDPNVIECLIKLIENGDIVIDLANPKVVDITDYINSDVDTVANALDIEMKPDAEMATQIHHYSQGTVTVEGDGEVGVVYIDGAYAGLHVDAKGYSMFGVAIGDPEYDAVEALSFDYKRKY